MNSEDWPEEWHWIADTLPEQFREEVISTATNEQCKEGSRLLWLRREFEDQRGE